MFGKSGSKSKKLSKPDKSPAPTGVLTSQKPTRQKPRRAKWKLYAIGTGCGLILVSSIAFYARWQPPKAKRSTTTKSTIEITLHPSMYNDASLSEKTLADLIDVAGNSLKDLDDHSLLITARSIQARFLADDVHLVRSASNRVTLMVRMRHAIMRIKADEMRYLSQKGQVYGEVKDGEASDLVQLTGVFDTSSEKLRMNDSHTAILSADQQQIIQEALNLRELLEQSPMRGNFAELHYVKFRGFTIKSTKDDFEVALGRAPFDRKVNSLDKILNNLKKRGSQAQRIELDYDGKAFIKEKRI